MKLDLSKIGEYRKGLVGAANLLAAVVAAGLLQGQTLAYATMALTALAAVGVVAVPNDRPKPAAVDSAPAATMLAAPAPVASNENTSLRIYEA